MSGSRSGSWFRYLALASFLVSVWLLLFGSGGQPERRTSSERVPSHDTNIIPPNNNDIHSHHVNTNNNNNNHNNNIPIPPASPCPSTLPHSSTVSSISSDPLRENESEIEEDEDIEEDDGDEFKVPPNEQTNNQTDVTSTGQETTPEDGHSQETNYKMREAHDMSIFQFMSRLNVTFLPKKLAMDKYVPNPKHAIVTLANQAYSPLAVALATSLREVKTRVPNIIILSHANNPVTSEAMEQLHSLGTQVRIIQPIKHTAIMDIPGGPDAFWGAAWSKLMVWNLTEFEKVVYIDCDCIAVNNIDHLFGFPEFSSPSTSPSCSISPTEFNDRLLYEGFFRVGSGIFVAQPNRTLFEYMLDLSTRPAPLHEHDDPIAVKWHFGDMQMMSQVFWREQNRWHRLDQREYDILMGNCHDPLIDGDKVKTLHFTCTPYAKPWAVSLNSLSEVRPCVKASHQLWYWLFTKASLANDYWGVYKFYSDQQNSS